jgi:plastocyanin
MIYFFSESISPVSERKSRVVKKGVTMNKPTSKIAVILVAMLSLVILSACGAKDEIKPGASTPGISLSITDETCPSVGINLNDQITWVNEDKIEHLIEIIYPDGSTKSGVDVLKPGDTATLTFPQAGTYTYVCTKDGESTGTITVNP